MWSCSASGRVRKPERIVLTFSFYKQPNSNKLNYLIRNFYRVGKKRLTDQLIIQILNNHIGQSMFLLDPNVTNYIIFM